MSITLTIVDNADGTGATISWAGTDADSRNWLYFAPWTGQPGMPDWVNIAGAETGRPGDLTDGNAALDPGYWLWRLDSVFAGVTTVIVVYQPITNAATQAMLDRALDAAVTRVQGLNLSGSPAVSKRWLPRAKNGDTFPLIAVTPVGSESFPGVLTTQDDIGLPFAVTAIDKANQDPTANISRDLLWRQQILSAFRYQRLAGVPEGTIVQPEPMMIVNPGMFDDKNLIFSPLFFRLITRTERG